LNEIRKNTEKGFYDPQVVDVLFEILKFDASLVDRGEVSSLGSK
jgi:HD-GYP domain-containing protein (c-di-GMP phosphodiesterase class II)